VSSGKCVPFGRNFLPSSTTITELETFTEFPLNVCQTVRTHIPEGTTISYHNCYFKPQFLPAVHKREVHSPSVIMFNYIGTRLQKYPLLHHTISGCITPRRQVVRAAKFCTMTPDICRSSVWNLRHVTFTASVHFRWLLDFQKICATLALYSACCMSSSGVSISDLRWRKYMLTKPRRRREGA